MPYAPIVRDCGLDFVATAPKLSVIADTNGFAAVLIEKGDPSRTQAQILRHLEAIAPGVTLLSLRQESDPSLAALRAREFTHGVRPLSKVELDELDF